MRTAGVLAGVNTGISLAASAPDLGSPTTIPVLGFVGAFLGAAYARRLQMDRSEVREHAEDWGFVATGFAIVFYLFGLITNLY